MNHEPAIVFENGQALRFVCQDFGNAGIKFSMQDDRNNINAVILSGTELDNLQEWLSRTTNRPIMALPPSTSAFIDEIVAQFGKSMSKKQSRTARQIKTALDSLISEETPTGKKNSRQTRALSRTTRMPGRSK